MTEQEQKAFEFMRDALLFCKANAGKPELVWMSANEGLIAAKKISNQQEVANRVDLKKLIHEEVKQCSM